MRLLFLTQPPQPLMQGSDVLDLQNKLNAHGAQPPVVTDGVFGKKTDEAVRQFQTANDLTVDGVVGPLTMTKLLAQPITPTPVPPTPDPVPPVTHDYKITAFWDKPEYVVDDTGYFGLTLFDGDQPVVTEDMNACPGVSLSDNEDGPVPVGPDGSGAVPWSASNPGTYTATAYWNTPEGLTITATADSVWAAKPNPTEDGKDEIPTNSKLIGVIDYWLVGEAIQFTLSCKDGDITPVQFDTGAFKLMFTKDNADQLKLPNLGSIVVGGVGGQSTAYTSKVTFTIGANTFADVDCVVDPDFQGVPLFGYDWFDKQGIDFVTDEKNRVITLFERP
jgi:peptidoglycan hydrolase-like protein with peptidoglycan-binding domain